MSFVVNKVNLNEIPVASQGDSKGLLPSVNLVTLNGMSIKKSEKGKTAAMLHVEGKPIEGFEGFDRPDGSKASGKVATVSIGAWVDSNDFESDRKNIDRIVTNLRLIGDACGVVDKIDAIKANNAQDYFDKASSIINGKYFWCILNGYINNKGFWSAGSINEYPVDKGKPTETKYVQVCPENAVKSTKPGPNGTIIEAVYTNNRGKESKLTWNPDNKWCLNRDKAPTTAVADEDVPEVRQPDF
jgi:hypothetical protein